MRAEHWFLGAGIALCLFSLWALGRHDWLRLTRPSRRVLAQVTGHQSRWEDGARAFAAIYAFADEQGDHEVIDAVHTATPRPPLGTRVELAYPLGHPGLARPPRPLLWLACYALLLGLTALLLVKAGGGLPD